MGSTSESKDWIRCREDIEIGIKNEVLAALGLSVNHVKVVNRGTLPKTSSGKLQRAKTRELFFEGKFEFPKASFLQRLFEKVGGRWKTS